MLNIPTKKLASSVVYIQLSRTFAASKMFLLKIAVTLVTVLTFVEAKGNYWWMDELDSAFGAGNNGGNKPIRKQQNFNNFPAQQQQKPQGGYQSTTPSPPQQQPSKFKNRWIFLHFAKLHLYSLTCNYHKNRKV